MLLLNLHGFADEARLRRVSMDARVKPAHDEDTDETRIKRNGY
jgi:hypothetical protein